MNLGGIDAVESAIEFGFGEELIGVFIEFAFLLKEFGWRNEGGLRIVADGFEISGKLRKSATDDAGEGRVDGAELGGFKVGVVFCDEIADVIHTGVKLFDGVGGLGATTFDKQTDAGKQNQT